MARSESSLTNEMPRQTIRLRETSGTSTMIHPGGWHRLDVLHPTCVATLIRGLADDFSDTQLLYR